MMQKSVLKLASRPPPLPLQKLSLITVTTNLFNHRQLLNLIVESYFSPSANTSFCTIIETEWAAIQAMANQLISEIHTGVALKKKILESLWPVSYKIMSWKYMYARSIGSKFLQQFYWTNRGRIDNIRTIQHVVRNENISIGKRFILACRGCLSKEIHEMWGEMSNDDKKYFYGENRHIIRRLLLFWAHTMGGSDNVFSEFLPGALACAVENGLIEAVKYLFGLLTADDRRKMAVSCMVKFMISAEILGFLGEDQIDIGYFLFFEMAEENQMFLFSSHSFLALSLLLHSSDNKLFLNLLAERIQFLSEFHIRILLLMIFHDYRLEVKDYDYSVLFIDVWRMLPSPIRYMMADTGLGVEFLGVLIMDNFMFLLEKDALKEMQKFILSDTKTSSSTIRFGFHRGKWDFLHTLILEGLVTISSLEKYKCRFLSFLPERIKHNEAAWNGILRFVVKIMNKIPIN